MSDDSLLVALAGHDLAPLSDPDACARFATDATRWVESVPALMLRPADTAGFSAVLAACHSAGRPVVVQGELTGLSGGARVRPGEVVLSLERMRRLGPVDPLSAQIEVEAGATLHAVQPAAAEHDLVFGVDLGALGTATIGGMVATNTGGVRVLRYGMMRA